MSSPLVVIKNPQDKQGLEISPRAYERGLSCVHCGLCLPACPTYLVNGLEADSPRGRIQLMLGLAEGKIEATKSVREHLDLCLDCRGCESACPSGVVYHELIEDTRAHLAQTQNLTAQSRFMQVMFFKVFTKSSRLRLALLPARVLQKMGLYPLLRKSGIFNFLPAQIRKMEQMLPSNGPLWPKSLPEHTASALVRSAESSQRLQPGERAPAEVPQSATQIMPPVTIGFFSTCVGSVLFDKVDRQAVELLAACGAEVIAPRSQGCCGAIHQHNGAHASAAEMARNNIDTYLPLNSRSVDFIVTAVAGCGAMLREYDFVLRDDPLYVERAKEFVTRVRDISEVLLELGLPEMRHSVNATVTYHDACHLLHAQRVSAAPRMLLAKVPGLKTVVLPESEICCGAAGTYNLTQPAMSTALAERKLKSIIATGADLCATGNVGCSMQIQSQALAQHLKLGVVHPVELLHRAVFG